jgi:hypothetical protein
MEIFLKYFSAAVNVPHIFLTFLQEMPLPNTMQSIEKNCFNSLYHLIAIICNIAHQIQKYGLHTRK